jgi:spore coat polysaccharide biosynthesis protein SpsF
MSARQGSTLAVVQARTTSRRLPGKVLMDIHGAPMILRQLDRVRRASTVDHIVVATSDDPSDDELARIVIEAGYDVVRGSLNDVLARFCAAVDQYDGDVIVRITADCPLISPNVIDLVVESFQTSNADYVSNTLIPSFPDGLDVEVVTADAIRQIADSSTDPNEREHVTLGIYRRPEQFVVANVVDPTGRDHSDLRWTVDNADDLAFVTQVYDALFPENPGFEYQDVLELLMEHPEWNRTEAHAKRNAALDGLDTGAMRQPGSQVRP